MGRHGGDKASKEDRDNRANQLNPNNDAFWQSRGFEEHPDSQQERASKQPQPATKPSSK